MSCFETRTRARTHCRWDGTMRFRFAIFAAIATVLIGAPSTAQVSPAPAQSIIVCLGAENFTGGHGNYAVSWAVPGMSQSLYLGANGTIYFRVGSAPQLSASDLAQHQWAITLFTTAASAKRKVTLRFYQTTGAVFEVHVNWAAQDAIC